MAGFNVFASGAWRASKGVWVFASGAWRKAKKVFVFTNNAWRECPLGVTRTMRVAPRIGSTGPNAWGYSNTWGGSLNPKDFLGVNINEIAIGMSVNSDIGVRFSSNIPAGTYTLSIEGLGTFTASSVTSTSTLTFEVGSARTLDFFQRAGNSDIYVNLF